MIDWRRVAAEKRAVLVPMAVVALVNLAAYVFLIYPLATRAGSVEARARTATANLNRATAEFNAAQALKTGRERADTQLAKFYDRDPAAGPGRRAPHHVSAPGTAGRGGEPRLRAAQRDHQPRARERARADGHDDGAERRLPECATVPAHAQTSPEFVVIEEVSLAQGEQDAPLTLTLNLATYFRSRP